MQKREKALEGQEKHEGAAPAAEVEREPARWQENLMVRNV